MMQGNQLPVIVVNKNAQREQGLSAQVANIRASKAVADIIRTTLGPKSMLKMLLDPMGGLVLTNDGNAILREIDVKHPAAKSMIELARAQDEEVGDGTTSVIVLAGEAMSVTEEIIEQKIHPTVIVQAYFHALEKMMEFTDSLATPVDVDDPEIMSKVMNSCIGTKFSSRWGDLIERLAIQAVRTVKRDQKGILDIDVKRYAKIEKIPGGDISECRVLNGTMLNKDVTHGQMRRKIENPRVVLLDGSLEYKKGESQTNLELSKEDDWATVLQMEEEEIKRMCDDLLRFDPDVVVVEKGVSDLAQHFLMKKNVSVLRRARKTDNNRISRVTGATIVNRPDELQETDVGTKCGLFEVRKIGDDYFAFFEECQEPQACSILLRGATKDSLNEIERNLHDAMAVARNIFLDPRVVTGGGSVEMELSYQLQKYAKTLEGSQQWPLRAVAKALEVIPRTLAQNCGSDVVRVVTDLRARHASEEDGCQFWGIDGTSGVIADMREVGVYETLNVKKQVYKTALESACLLLRIDDILSGLKKKEETSRGAGVPEDIEI